MSKPTRAAIYLEIPVKNHGYGILSWDFLCMEEVCLDAVPFIGCEIEAMPGMFVEVKRVVLSPARLPGVIVSCVENDDLRRRIKDLQAFPSFGFGHERVQENFPDTRAQKILDAYKERWGVLVKEGWEPRKPPWVKQ